MIALSRFLLRPVFLWLLMLCVLSGVARAQTPVPTPKGPLQMALSSPLALTAKPLALSVKAGRWVPVAINLSNTGADGVKGEVRLRMISQGGFEVAPNDYYTTVDLPSNSNKVVWLYGRMERPNIGSFEITFSGRGFSALKQTVPVAPLDEEQRLVVTIADNDDGLQGALKSLRANGLFRGGKKPQFNANLQPIRAIQAPSTDVPDRWIGFDCADMVILGDFVHTALAPKQLDAIKEWTQGGGNLVVIGGNNAARLNSSPVRELWPIQPANSAPASAAEVQKLATRYVPNPANGADRLGGAPVVVVRGTLDAAAILKDGTREAPLFAQGERGAGRVLQLAYNPGQPPFVGWSGQGNLWGDIVNSMVDVRRIDIGDTEFVSYGSGSTQGPGPTYNGGYNSDGEQTPTAPTGQILKGLSQVKQLKMPPVSQIAWFLALYVFFLVPVNYAVLRLMDKRELAWITIPVIVAAFSIFAYSAALSIRGTAILTRQVDVVQSSLGSNQARTDSLLWLFSPKRTTYTLTSSVPGAVVADYANDAGAKQGAFSISEPGDNSSFSAENANVWMWTDRAFSGQAIGDLGKGVTLNGNALGNNTPLDLRGAVWVKDGRVWGLGDIKQGASAQIVGEGTATSGADLPGAIANAANLSKIFDESTISNGIPSNAMRLAMGDGKLNGTPMLVAWSKTSLAPIPVGQARGDNVTLIIVRAANLTGAMASQRATLKPVSLLPFDPSAGGDPSGGGYKIYNAILPQQSNLTLQARGLGISANPNAPNYGNVQLRPGATPMPTTKTKDKTQTWVHFEVLDARSGKWQPLQGEMKRDKSPARGWNFRAPINPQMARMPDRSLSVRARLDNAQAQVSSVGIG